MLLGGSIRLEDLNEEGMKNWDVTAGSRRRLGSVSCCVCMLQGIGYSLRRVDRAGAGGGGDEGQGGHRRRAHPSTQGR